MLRLAAFLLLLVVSLSAKGDDKPNVLFIAVDDLKPALGCYDDPIAKTPNIDRLASQGTTFLKTYCQQAVCNPSRVSLLTSLRPETTEIFDLETAMRDKVPDVITLPQHFKQNGYYTERTGKIYHMGHGVGDDSRSWSVTRNFAVKPRYGPKEEADLKKRVKAARAKGVSSDKLPRGRPYGAPEVGDHDLRDGGLVADVRQILDAASESGKPFFTAVGFLNPHLPFVSPKRYWDLYTEDEIRSRLSAWKKPAGNAPDFALHTFGELRKYYEVPSKGPVSAEDELKLIHGYYAAVSYVDALVGEILDELESRDLRKNTIVVLWGDHGWHLGDHGIWCKHSNYEQATRVPLIISAPNQKNAGSRVSALAEFVDVYPTLADLAGLEVPDHVEGVSLTRLMESPNSNWSKPAFHLYPRGSRMGRAIRTDRFRLVEWTDRKSGKSEAIEFYDYEADPLETKNLAKDPKYQREVTAHLQLLRKGGKARSGMVKLPKNEDFHLFLLAGQSNMAGRGLFDEHSQKIDPRVYALNSADTWGFGLDPLHSDKTVARVGLGKTFGESVATGLSQGKVGLIPVAWGGSPIRSWEPGGFHEQTNSHPWDEAMVRAKKALQEGTLKGILWHQGESDANEEDAPHYKERLVSLINRFRKELEAPEIPFIIGQMAIDTPEPWTSEKKMVDAAQQEVANELDHVYFVPSNGLTLKDKVHFDAKSYRELGRRFAKVYLQAVE